MQTIIKCPQCGGNKVRSMKVLTSTFMWIGVICCMTIIGIPIGVLSFLCALAAKLMKYHLKFSCRECKHEFKVSESIYGEYTKELKQKEEAPS